MSRKRQPLTARELEVLTLAAKGLTNIQIAAQRDRSPQTVKNQMSTVYSKLGAANRADAVAIGMRTGLIPGKKRRMNDRERAQLHCEVSYHPHVSAPIQSLYPRTQRTWWARLWRSLRWR